MTNHIRENNLTITFDQEILIDNFNYSDSIELSVTGPLSPYKFSAYGLFIDNKTLTYNISMSSTMTGNNEEQYLLNFTTSNFVSQNGATLYTKSLSGSLFKVLIGTESIEQAGSSLNSAVGGTIVTLIASNLMFGTSSEMLWGFINTLQIMYFWPVLSLNYPDHLRGMIVEFSASKLQVSIPFIDSAQQQMEFAYSLDQPPVNENFEDIDYESTSILVNGFEFMRLVFQGIITCIFVFALRALLVTLHAEEYTSLLDDEANGIPTQRNNSKKTRMGKYIRKKVKELSLEYKFNFFLRVGIELYLEVTVLSLLNIRYPKFEKISQCISFGVA